MTLTVECGIDLYPYGAWTLRNALLDHPTVIQAVRAFRKALAE